MKLNDWLTLVAIVLGPLLAVGITVLFEASRRQKERRLGIVRMLLATRHMAAHAEYNAAINLIPAEFNDQKEVMAAWRTYHERVRQQAGPGLAADHMARVNAAQSALIFQVMRSSGLKLSEGDIQTQAYVSQGFLDRDNLYLKSLAAIPEIAEAMKTQVAHTKTMLDSINLQARQRAGPALPPPSEPLA